MCRTTMLTATCGIQPGWDVCARHAALADAYHYLACLPERAADGAWSEAGVRRAVAFWDKNTTYV